jgi:hypothetical protein
MPSSSSSVPNTGLLCAHCTLKGEHLWIRGHFRLVTKLSFSTSFFTGFLKKKKSVNDWSFVLGWGFGLVVRAAAWHAGDPSLILGRDSFYTFAAVDKFISMMD